MSRVIVTGGLGFIGTNIVRRLNAMGIRDIVITDRLTPLKEANLLDVSISDFIPADKFDIRDMNRKGDICIFHMGGKSSTTSSLSDVIRDNVRFSNDIFDFAHSHPACNLVYASSASVYGNGPSNSESSPVETNSNYSWSKATIENRKIGVGLRFFNVYGPHERHKGNQSSCIRQFWQSLASNHPIEVFVGPDDIRRDFVHVDDVVRICIQAAGLAGRRQNPYIPFLNGDVYNVGTGRSSTFLEVAELVKNQYVSTLQARGGQTPDVLIRMVNNSLTSSRHYQRHTQADMCKTNMCYQGPEFMSLSDGVASYCQWIADNEHHFY